MIRVYNNILDWLIKACAVGACLFMAFMTVAISLEVVLRSFFAMTMQFTDEYSGYLVLATCALGVAYAREQNSLLVVDFIIRRLPPSVRAKIDFVYGLAALAFCLFLLYYITNFWLSTIARGLTSGTLQRTPLWIPQALLVLGFALLCLVIARKLVRPDQEKPSELDAVLADLK